MASALSMHAEIMDPLAKALPVFRMLSMSAAVLLPR